MRTNTLPVTVVIVTAFAGARVLCRPRPRRPPCPWTRKPPRLPLVPYAMQERVMEIERDGREENEGRREKERTRGKWGLKEIKGDAKNREEATVAKVTGVQTSLRAFQLFGCV